MVNKKICLFIVGLMLLIPVSIQTMQRIPAGMGSRGISERFEDAKKMIDSAKNIADLNKVDNIINQFNPNSGYARELRRLKDTKKRALPTPLAQQQVQPAPPAQPAAKKQIAAAQQQQIAKKQRAAQPVAKKQAAALASKKQAEEKAQRQEVIQQKKADAQRRAAAQAKKKAEEQIQQKRKEEAPPLPPRPTKQDDVRQRKVMLQQFAELSKNITDRVREQTNITEKLNRDIADLANQINDSETQYQELLRQYTEMVKDHKKKPEPGRELFAISSIEETLNNIEQLNRNATTKYQHLTTLYSGIESDVQVLDNMTEQYTRLTQQLRDLKGAGADVTQAERLRQILLEAGSKLYDAKIHIKGKVASAQREIQNNIEPLLQRFGLLRDEALAAKDVIEQGIAQQKQGDQEKIQLEQVTQLSQLQEKINDIKTNILTIISTSKQHMLMPEEANIIESAFTPPTSDDLSEMVRLTQTMFDNITGENATNPGINPVLIKIAQETGGIDSVTSEAASDAFKMLSGEIPPAPPLPTSPQTQEPKEQTTGLEGGSEFIDPLISTESLVGDITYKLIKYLKDNITERDKNIITAIDSALGNMHGTILNESRKIPDKAGQIKFLNDYIARYRGGPDQAIINDIATVLENYFVRYNISKPISASLIKEIKELLNKKQWNEIFITTTSSEEDTPRQKPKFIPRKEQKQEVAIGENLKHELEKVENIKSAMIAAIDNTKSINHNIKLAAKNFVNDVFKFDPSTITAVMIQDKINNLSANKEIFRLDLYNAIQRKGGQLTPGDLNFQWKSLEKALLGNWETIFNLSQKHIKSVQQQSKHDLEKINMIYDYIVTKIALSKEENLKVDAIDRAFENPSAEMLSNLPASASLALDKIDDAKTRQFAQKAFTQYKKDLEDVD